LMVDGSKLQFAKKRRKIFAPLFILY